MSSNIHSPKTYKEYKNLFDELSDIIIVDFYADWCGPCKKLAVSFKEWCKEFKKLSIIKVDVDNDEFDDLKEKYEVKGIPRILIFNNGNLIKDITGNRPDDILKVLNKV
jgi:thioredoxin 1